MYSTTLTYLLTVRSDIYTERDRVCSSGILVVTIILVSVLVIVTKISPVCSPLTTKMILTCSRQETSRPGSRLAMPGRRRGRRGGASVTGAASLVDAPSGGGTVVTVVDVVVDVASGTSGSASGGLSCVSLRRAYTFTMAYSTNAANTKTRQADIQTSIALT